MSRAAWLWALIAVVAIVHAGTAYGFGPAVMAAAACFNAFCAGLAAIPEKPRKSTDA